MQTRGFAHRNIACKTWDIHRNRIIELSAKCVIMHTSQALGNAVYKLLLSKVLGHSILKE